MSVLGFGLAQWEFGCPRLVPKNSLPVILYPEVMSEAGFVFMFLVSVYKI